VGTSKVVEVGMTQEEKHALIATRLDGWKAVKGFHIYQDPVYEDPDGIRTFDLPEYSTDLNLCARVEAKIAEMGWTVADTYLDALWDLCPENMPLNWWMATATPTVRVDAMVSLIESLKP
jgi:hypothetical protein